MAECGAVGVIAGDEFLCDYEAGHDPIEVISGSSHASPPWYDHGNRAGSAYWNAPTLTEAVQRYEEVLRRRTGEIVLAAKACPATEYNRGFLQGMVNRMAVSFHKYGAVAKAYPHDLDALASLEDRVVLYRETGNTEWLMDVANFAMIEFMRPKHPDAHYRPTDSDESPGRRTKGGSVTDAPNGDRRTWL